MKLSLEKLQELLPGFYLDQREKNLIGPCPECGHKEFGVSIEEGHRFGCYRKAKCGFNGNIIVLLKYLGRYDEVVQEKTTNLPKKIDKVVYEAEFEDAVSSMDPPIGWRRVFDHSYLNNRGFSKEDYERYPVGITAVDPRLRKDYVIFLVYQDYEVKGWVARHRASKEELERLNLIRKGQEKPLILRYRNSISDFSKLCYGIDEVDTQTENLIIVEGIFDKINTDKQLNLHEDFKTRCICTFKAGLSEEQLSIIKRKGPNIKSITLLYDGDVVRITKTVSSKLQKDYKVKVGYHRTKDPGDMDKSDFLEVLNNLQTPIEFKSFKLEVNKLK